MDPPKKSRKKSRWWKVLAGLTLLLVLVAFVGPVVATPIVRDAIVQGIEEETGGRVTFEEFAVKLPARVVASGFVLADAEGARAASAGELRGSLRPMSLLGGELELALSVEGWEVVAREEEDGTWSYPGSRTEREGGSEGGADSEPPAGGEEREVALELELLQGRVKLESQRGAATLEDVQLVASITPGGQASSFQLSADAVGPLGTASRFNLSGEIVRGQESGSTSLRGLVTYHPERLASLIRPWFELDLFGDSERKVMLDLEGLGLTADPRALLSATTGTISAELGRFETAGLDAYGEVRLGLEGGRASVKGSLTANGGELELEGDLDLVSMLHGTASQEGSRLKLEAREIRANRGLSPILSRLHPAFATLDAVEGGRIEGQVNFELDLDVADVSRLMESTMEELERQLAGAGSFEVAGLSLRGSPALDDMLALLGIDGGRSLDLSPISFVVRDGRLTYEQPWGWEIDGVQTSFTGGVGLDGTLDLQWNVPVSDHLAEKHRALRFLRGKEIRLPLSGSASRPRIEWREALSDLATEAAGEELLGQLGVSGQAGDDPATLLADADRLWDEGREKEAAALYRRLREEFRLSLVYIVNKDRIKERAKKHKD